MKDITTETAPKMIWLQVDCNADADDRGERFPDPPEGVSWNPESVQGLEVEYVRADLVRAALTKAEAALADIGDADREPGDDVAWCERRAAQALPTVRAALHPTAAQENDDA